MDELVESWDDNLLVDVFPSFRRLPGAQEVLSECLLNDWVRKLRFSGGEGGSDLGAAVLMVALPKRREKRE